MEEMEADLFCVHCLRETPHRVAYQEGLLHHIECEECHRLLVIERGRAAGSVTAPSAQRVTRRELSRHFKGGFLQRILTKPSRMTREMERDLTAFLVSLPLRILTKPFRVLEEILRREE